MYGPILTVLCVYGITDFSALSKVCTMQGISRNTNYVNLFILFSSLLFAISVTFAMAMEKSIDMA